MARSSEFSSMKRNEYLRKAPTDDLIDTVTILERIQQDRRNGISGSKNDKQITDKDLILRTGEIKRELKKRNGAVSNGYK